MRCSIDLRSCPSWQPLFRLKQRPRSWLRSLGLMLVTIFLSLGLHAIAFASDAATPIQTPLSTRGSQIVDAKGRPVLLRGVNWFGIETELHVPHGLWQRDYKEMLAQIKSLGYNVIRLPFAVQSLRSNSFTGVDFSIGSNRELENKTPLEVMDLVIQEAQRQGLMILLDSHRLNDQRIPELWYGDGFTESDWLDSWKMLANRYKNQPNVIGADLKNEPHGRASWGTNDVATDWRLAAERAGNAILQVNPNWLIVVEGVEKNVPGQRLQVHWWGGNLEGVKRFPVRLQKRNKVVYSPHEYGPGVSNQTWFNEPSFPKNLRDRWEIGFHYIARQSIAPILIGEFGGRQVDSLSKEGIWQRELVQFIKEKRLSFAYWSWNPNSGDTGGILQDDWQSIHQDKQTLLNQLFPVASLPPSEPIAVTTAAATPRPTNPTPIPASVPTPPPLPNPTPAPIQPSSGLPGLTSQTRIQSDWETGFCAEFLVTNPSAIARAGNWRLTFQMNQADLKSNWNGRFERQGNQYTVTPPDWALTMQPNQTVNVGFCADKRGSDYQPKQVRVQ